MPHTMQVWECRGYGGPDRLVLAERPVPVPRQGEVLVRIAATTVSSGDARIRALRLPPGFSLIGRPMLGFFGPRQKILGTEFAGHIAALGPGVTGWREGDAVVGFPGAAQGCHAEYRTMPVTRPLIAWPAGVSLEQAAALGFGGTTARHFLRRAQVGPGTRLLVIGASGTVGSAMVQLARAAGAEVTGVTSARNLDLVRSLGADTIDYGQQDFRTLGRHWDVIADTVAAASFGAVLPCLAPAGRYLPIAGGLADLLARPRQGRTSIGGPAAERPEDLVALGQLAEAGAFRPVVGAVMDWQQMPQAHALVDSGHKRGSVVVRVGPAV